MATTKDFRVSKADLGEFLDRLGIKGGPAREKAMRTMMVFMVEALMEEIEWEFDRRAEGYAGEFSSRWQPLLPSTIARKRRAGFPRPESINVRTERLSHALRAGSVANNRYYSRGDQRVTINGNVARIKIDVPYFKHIQEGKRPVWTDVTFKAMARKAISRGLRRYVDSIRG